MKKIKILILLVLVGCADGPDFERVQLNGDDAVVYFYRPEYLGWRLPPFIITEAVTSKCVAKLLPGGYYPYITKPGEKTFTCSFGDEIKKISFKIEANQEYFIKSTFDIWVFRIFALPLFVRVPKKYALEDIEDKKLSIVKD